LRDAAPEKSRVDQGTDRLLLTLMTDADLDSIHEIYSDPATWLHLPSGRFEGRTKTEQMFEGSDRSWRLAGLGQWSVRLRLGIQESSCAARGVVGTGGQLEC
jgi:RimJ/RimL family protein N-acetyltransferase